MLIKWRGGKRDTSPYIYVYLISQLKRSEQDAAQRHNLGGTVFAKGVRENLMYLLSING